MDGLKIFNSFKRHKIESLGELNNKKYYLESVNYPVKIVDVDDWIKVVERLQIRKIKEKMRRTDTELCTGLIKCHYCNQKLYFNYRSVVSKGKKYSYKYYRHIFYNREECNQTPKSLDLDRTDEIFEVFFFYFYLVYDDTKVLIEENQKVIKINMMEIKEKIKDVESENRKIDKQKERFDSIYEKSEDTELLKLTLIKETELNKKREKNTAVLNKLKNDLEGLNKRYNDDELELTYYNVKEMIVGFFEEMTVEERRNSLFRIIKECILFNKYIVIDTGKVLFIFNTEDEIYLTTDMYEQFKKDNKFKENFIKSSSLVNDDGTIREDIKEFMKNNKKDSEIIKMMMNYLEVRKLGDTNINNYNLNNGGKINIKDIMLERLRKIGIEYPISGIDKIISFTEL
jgi:hypothetical protein